MLYVHTPQLEPRGIFATFQSNLYERDEAFYMDDRDTRYIGHRKWPADDLVTMLRTNEIRARM